MNLLEQYIKEIHSEVEVINDGKTYVVVDATFTCYGNEQRHMWAWAQDEWTEIKKNGYYWG